MKAYDLGKVLCEQPKNEREKIVVTWKVFNDHVFIDLRLWVRDNAHGPWRPTEKGFTLPPERLLIFGTRLVDAGRMLQPYDGVNP